jgi:B12-binding domain/radical SAM domain protein of rhizo-twelve system
MMRSASVALINPAWNFDGSIYFGCREPHLPLELGYARTLLEMDGHHATIIDAHLEELSADELRDRVAAVRPDMIVVTTAPSYLFWRCPPPELRVPAQTIRDLQGLAPAIVAVGPHGSSTPVSTLQKLSAQAVVLGECEEVLVALARTPVAHWDGVPSVAVRRTGDSAGDGGILVNGAPHASDLERLPPLLWPRSVLDRHAHHHHRFDSHDGEPGAEMEASRGCPYRCSFCAKETHRDRYRKRPLALVLAELDMLIAHGVRYVYFIDEIFLPDQALLQELKTRRITFGIQTRIDRWSPAMLDLLGEAGCVTIEAGIESVSAEGRQQLQKGCRLSTDQLGERLAHAKTRVAFVQATLMESKADDPAQVDTFRRQMQEVGVWVNEPVPLFPYPGSPDYTRLWGAPDELAWERAHDHYLRRFDRFSDIQEKRPVSLPILEDNMEGAGR